MANLETIGADKANFTTALDPRVPCVVICDTSASMSGEPIQELNDGLKALYDDLSLDRLASRVVDLAVVTFGGDVLVAQDFRTVEMSFVPTLTAEGCTPMGEAVNTALDLMEIQKQHYNEARVPRRRGWIFLISDGAPTDEWLQAAARAISFQDSQSVLFFSIGVQGADLAMLGRFSQQPVYSLDGLRFVELFKWLSKSMKAASRRANLGPGNLPSIKDWSKE
jgi:uncharacterized protein YegL